jgi:hypothetical protein
MKSIDRRAVRSLKGQVHSRDRTVCLVDVKLVRGKEPRAFTQGMRKIQRTKHCRVETFACLEVRHAKVYVIDQSADVKFHRELLMVRPSRAESWQFPYVLSLCHSDEKFVPDDVTLRWLPAAAGEGLGENRAFLDLRHFEQSPAAFRFLLLSAGSVGAKLVHEEFSRPVLDAIVVRLGHARTPAVLELDQLLPGDGDPQLLVN